MIKDILNTEFEKKVNKFYKRTKDLNIAKHMALALIRVDVNKFKESKMEEIKKEQNNEQTKK